MEAVHPLIVPDATAPPVPEKKEPTGIERGTERENTGTRTGIARALTPTDTRGRGERFSYHGTVYDAAPA